MHLFFLASTGPVICFVHGAFSHEDCRLPGPRTARSSATLYHPDLRRHCLVEDHMIHVRHVKSLLANTGRDQYVVLAISEIFKDLHLFALGYSEILLASAGLTHEPNGLDTVDPVLIVCYCFDGVSELGEDNDLGEWI